MTALDPGEQVLFVGYNAAYLRAVDGGRGRGSVVVIEEPDIIRKRGNELIHFAARGGAEKLFEELTLFLRGYF